MVRVSGHVQFRFGLRQVILGCCYLVPSDVFHCMHHRSHVASVKAKRSGMKCMFMSVYGSNEAVTFIFMFLMKVSRSKTRDDPVSRGTLKMFPL